ncbi:GNAT family N-acetyltransferase [Yinghuangia sp. ASG 101]|uniref:GNAT family N-acetyltransferase n=1 Tax=Yinghuangia sp. ASG 101 TaxID=2896848 RepID=UPI001E4B2266|nr:GNAT family N-acetyltransferase [Yinghuangia sp. ASG 101]UGQ09889.1 GNAT family N-acetyltransferase [Yinghuangia sp. ASG 101]
MLSSASSKVLDGADLPAILDLLGRDPVTNVFVASRVHLAGADPWRLGGELWGYYESGRLASLCYAGANLVPVEAGPEAIRSFADRARRQGRRCSSIVGPADAAANLWGLLEPIWGPARDVRPVQPLMVATEPSRTVTPDPRVRRVRRDEIDTVMPACVAMFTEEVGVSPLAGDGGALYRARVAELVNSGRAFARIEDGRVVFKAEIGAVTPHACQIQGVWVAPERRGEGLSEIGMAAVLDFALREIAPIASLYVNSYNTPARAAYRRVGFAETGAFMSVLF